MSSGEGRWIERQNHCGPRWARRDLARVDVDGIGLHRPAPRGLSTSPTRNCEEHRPPRRTLLTCCAIFRMRHRRRSSRRLCGTPVFISSPYRGRRHGRAPAKRRARAPSYPSLMRRGRVGISRENANSVPPPSPVISYRAVARRENRAPGGAARLASRCGAMTAPSSPASRHRAPHGYGVCAKRGSARISDQWSSSCGMDSGRRITPSTAPSAADIGVAKASVDSGFR